MGSGTWVLIHDGSDFEIQPGSSEFHLRASGSLFVKWGRGEDCQYVVTVLAQNWTSGKCPVNFSFPFFVIPTLCLSWIFVGSSFSFSLWERRIMHVFLHD